MIQTNNLNKRAKRKKIKQAKKKQSEQINIIFHFSFFDGINVLYPFFIYSNILIVYFFSLLILQFLCYTCFLLLGEPNCRVDRFFLLAGIKEGNQRGKILITTTKNQIKKLRKCRWNAMTATKSK